MKELEEQEAEGFDSKQYYKNSLHRRLSSTIAP